MLPPAGAPIPVSGMLFGLDVAFVVRTRVAVLGAKYVGWNVTVIVQLDEAVNVDPHVVVFANCVVVGRTFVIAMDEMLRVAVPVLVTVMDCPADVVPDACGPNVRLVADNDTIGPVLAAGYHVSLSNASGPPVPFAAPLIVFR